MTRSTISYFYNKAVQMLTNYSQEYVAKNQEEEEIAFFSEPACSAVPAVPAFSFSTVPTPEVKAAAAATTTRSPAKGKDGNEDNEETTVLGAGDKHWDSNRPLFSTNPSKLVPTTNQTKTKRTKTSS
jgi:hypothetical protein